MRFLGALWLVCGCSFSPGGANGGDGGLVDSSGDGPTRPPMGPCGKPGVLADDFADGVAGPYWYVTNESLVIEQGNTLSVTPKAGVVDPWTGRASNPMVDLRDAAVEVEVRSMATGTAVVAEFVVLRDLSRYLGFYQSSGFLTATDGTSPRTIAFDLTLHRHWRIEETGGTARFSTSPDGITWTMMHQVVVGSWVSAVSINLGAANPSGVPSPGTTTFAELSTQVASASWCAAGSLSDNFDDNDIGDAWAYHSQPSPSCSASEIGMMARFDQNGGGACDAFYGSSALYSLGGSEIVAKIPTISNFTNGWSAYLSAWDLGKQNLQLFFANNEMCAEVATISGSTSTTKACNAYDPTHDLWRIREAAGMLFWETAMGPSPVSWTVERMLPTPFDVSSVRIYMGAKTDRNIGAGPGIPLGIDRFN